MSANETLNRLYYYMKSYLLFLRIAFRNVRRNSRRSLFTVIAIAFGLLCLIVFQALKVGLHREMVTSTIQLDAGAVQVHAEGYEMNITGFSKIERPDMVVSVLKKTGESRYSRRIKSSALLLAGKKSSSIIISGIVPEEEQRITFIKDRMVKGMYVSYGRGIVIGEELAKSIDVDIGDDVTLTLQDSNGMPVTNRFPVSGIYRTELATFDRSHVFMHLEEMQKLMHAEGAVTEIAVRSDTRNENDLSRLLKDGLDRKTYQIRTWQEIAPDVIQIIELNDATMQLLILIVFAIIAMGITNTMTMVVFERFRELGILSAIGTTPAGLLMMVVMESFFLGAIAAVAGSAASVAACSYLAKYGIDLTSFTSSNQYFANSHILKAYLLPRDLLVANAVTVLTSLVGGVYPAWKASRLKPVDAITHT